MDSCGLVHVLCCGDSAEVSIVSGFCVMVLEFLSDCKSTKFFRISKKYLASPIILPAFAAGSNKGYNTINSGHTPLLGHDEKNYALIGGYGAVPHRLSPRPAFHYRP